MTVFHAETDDGPIIRSMEDWFTLAPPKMGKLQWKDYRSAKELARAWFPKAGRPQVPAELTVLLGSLKETKEAAFTGGIPERKVLLDRFPGEPRNADLVLWGHANGRKVVISVEAKADEPFGPTIEERLASVSKKGVSSNVPQRVANLCNLIFGKTIEECSHLRYQLLHAVAGAFVEAENRKADVALFIVHEFLKYSEVKAENVAKNADDLLSFLQFFPELRNVTLSAGILLGPVFAKGSADVQLSIPLYLGKITRSLDS